MRCQAMKRNGARCKAQALVGSEFCTFHAPERREAVKRGRIEGGSVCQKPVVNLPPVEIENLSDVKAVLSEAINEVRGGRMDTGTANCLAYLANTMKSVMEKADLERRVEELERTLTPPS